MEALRLITEPQSNRLVIDLPPSFEHCRLEVIVMPAAPIQTIDSTRRRVPSPMLAGTVKLKDDLIAPATPESDWDALQ